MHCTSLNICVIRVFIALIEIGRYRDNETLEKEEYFKNSSRP